MPCDLYFYSAEGKSSKIFCAFCTLRAVAIAGSFACLCPCISLKGKRCRRHCSCPFADPDAHLYHLAGIYYRVMQRHLCKLKFNHTLLSLKQCHCSGYLFHFGWNFMRCFFVLWPSTPPQKGFSLFKCRHVLTLSFSAPSLPEYIPSYTDWHLLHFTNGGCFKVTLAAHLPEPHQPTRLFERIITIIN